MRTDARMPVVPLLLPLGAITAGITAAALFPGMIWTICISAIALACLCLAFRWRGAGVICMFAAAGAVSAWLATPPRLAPDAFSKHAHTYSARVESVNSPDVVQYVTATIDSIDGQPLRPSFRARLSYNTPTPPLSPGNTIRFRTSLLPPDYNSDKLPMAGDMQAWCFRNRIAAITPNISPGQLYITGYRQDLSTEMELWRYRLSDIILSRIFSADNAELLSALLTGDRRFLPDGLQEDFRAAGLAHVLALSGTHIAIIAFLVALLLWPLQLAGYNRTRMALTVILLWSYALFTGMAPSVVRAVIMASMILIGRILRRHTVPLNSLCAAALLILIFRPYDLFSIGFQLTFLAVGAILLFMPVTYRISRRWLRIPAQWGMLSICAVCGTAPLAAWYFHTFPTNFLFSNIAIGLLLPVYMFSGILALLSPAGSAASSFAVAISDFLFNLSSSVVHTSAHAGAMQLQGLSFTPWALIPWYLAIGVLWYACREKRIAYAVNALLLMVFAGILMLYPLHPSIEAYSTGSRYATVIIAREKNHAYIFTDAGTSTRRLIKRSIAYNGEDYFRTRRVDTVSMASDVLRTRHLQCTGDEWNINNIRYVIASETVPLGARPHPHYLVISRGFRLPVKEVTDCLRPRKVIISPLYNRRRAGALADTLRAAGIDPVIDY